MSGELTFMAWIVGLAAAVWLLWQAARWIERSSSLVTTVYDWEYGLLYVNGRFGQLLPAGRYVHLPFLARRDIYRLRRSDQVEVVQPVDVTSSDKLLFRLSALIVYRIVDPRAAFEGEYQHKLRLAVADALVKLAAARTLDAFLSDRAGADAALLPLVASPVCGCEIVAVSVTTVTMPPELRRLFVEIERARLEGIAALERARGEHAALRSLANAAGMLKTNPELMNLRILQTMASQGRNQLTVVIGDKTVLPSAAEAGGR